MARTKSSPTQRKKSIEIASKIAKDAESSASASSSSSIVKKKRRARNGVRAMREIRVLQSTFENLIPKAPFKRLVKDITLDNIPDGRWKKSALAALQEGCETVATDLLNEANCAARHRGAITIEPRDLRYAIRVLENTGLRLHD